MSLQILNKVTANTNLYLHVCQIAFAELLQEQCCLRVKSLDWLCHEVFDIEFSNNILLFKQETVQ